MADMLRNGFEWLEQMRAAHCSSPVNYEHNGNVLVVNATIGKTDYEVATDGDISVGSHVIDFLVTAADLGFTPEPGDRIEADGVSYEVMAIGEDTKGWRSSDPTRRTYRIHTRQTNQ